MNNKVVRLKLLRWRCFFGVHSEECSVIVGVCIQTSILVVKFLSNLSALFCAFALLSMTDGQYLRMFLICVLLRVVPQSCGLHVVADSFGSLTAQKKNESKMHTGFSFVDCHVDGTGIIYLGRAWGNYSRTVFSYTYLSNIIFPPGWSDFGFPDRQQ